MHALTQVPIVEAAAPTVVAAAAWAAFEREDAAHPAAQRRRRTAAVRRVPLIIVHQQGVLVERVYDSFAVAHCAFLRQAVVACGRLQHLRLHQIKARLALQLDGLHLDGGIHCLGSLRRASVISAH